jgi:hypothetical protein
LTTTSDTAPFAFLRSIAPPDVYAPSEHRPAATLRRLASLFAAVGLAATLGACGGGGSDSGETPFPTPTPSPAPPPAADDSGQVCAPTNPYVADATGSTTSGTLANEKAWLHTYMSGAYLWYGEMPGVDAGLEAYSRTSDVYGSLDNYFQALRTPALTASGKLRDQFSFTYPTKAWSDLINSGSESGYGIQWYMASPTPPRGVRIAYVEPGSPAAVAGLLRGDVLVSADGVGADDGTSSGVDTLNAALWPSANGQSHSFVVSRAGSNVSKALVSATVIKQPVPTTTVLNSGGRKVGYIVFNDHLASAEQPLIDAITTLKNAAVDDLVLDLRYNGGGYLYIASELAYMIAGSSRTSGKLFEHLQYNDKRSAETNSDDAKTPFFDTSCILNDSLQCTSQKALPTLGLSRVTVITTDATCSASEAVVNGLRGVNVEVRLIGGTTCGKPYGFTAKDNCGISYFPIEFKGVNAKGYGDYADGFTATCPAADDFDHAMGSSGEGMLEAALYNLQNNACSVAAAQAARRSVLSAGASSQGRLLRGPEREAKIVVPRR